MQSLHDILPIKRQGIHAENSKELAQHLKGTLKSGDIVLCKGSRGMHMEIVMNELLAAD
jgi:UDP-N-acetylmuramyl pentapeptide synthase